MTPTGLETTTTDLVLCQLSIHWGSWFLSDGPESHQSLELHHYHSPDIDTSLCSLRTTPDLFHSHKRIRLIFRVLLSLKFTSLAYRIVGLQWCFCCREVVAFWLALVVIKDTRYIFSLYLVSSGAICEMEVARGLHPTTVIFILRNVFGRKATF